MGLLDRVLGRAATVQEPAPDASEPVLINAYATVRETPTPDFAHELHNRRDRSDPELAPHLHGFAGYVMQRGDGQMTSARYHLWRHIQRVRHQLSFSVAERDLPSIESWALRVNAVLFLPDGSVRAPEGTPLMTGDGVFDPAAALPYPPDAIARREATLAHLEGAELRPPASMPPPLGTEEVVLRSASEVRRRALALFCVAAHGQASALGAPDVRPMLTERTSEGMAALTPQEQAFLATDTPDPQAAGDMAWRFEALNTLLWALEDSAGRIDGGDLAADSDALAQAACALATRGTAHLRPAAEILDALDMAWRQHWIVRQARQKNLPLETLNPDVIAERHFALNWLTGFHNEPGTEWDDTDTPS